MSAQPKARRSYADCVGFPGYSVDDQGNVYSHWMKIRRAGPASGFSTAIDPHRRKLMQPEPDMYGYLRVRLRVEGKRKWARVNVLVLEAFDEPRPDSSYHCRHLDGDRENNAIANLAWGTAQENAADKRRHGTILSGVKHPAAKFSTSEVVEILQAHSNGMNVAVIAALYKVSPATIRDLVAGRTYKRFRRE